MKEDEGVASKMKGSKMKGEDEGVASTHCTNYLFEQARGQVLLYHMFPFSSSLGLVTPPRHLRFHATDLHAF